MFIRCIDVNLFFFLLKHRIYIKQTKLFFVSPREGKNEMKGKEKFFSFYFLLLFSCVVMFNLFSITFFPPSIKAAMFDDVLCEMFCDFKAIENTITDTLFNIFVFD